MNKRLFCVLILSVVSFLIVYFIFNAMYSKDANENKLEVSLQEGNPSTVANSSVDEYIVILLSSNLEVVTSDKNFDKSTVREFSEVMLDNLPERARGLERVKQAKYDDIDFYGQFIDQWNRPIIGIDMMILVYQPLMLGGWTKVPVYTQSDNEGRFHLTGIRGEFFTIQSLVKKGYIFSKESIGESIGHSRRVLSTSKKKPHLLQAWAIENQANDIRRFRVSSDKSFIPDGRWYTTNITEAKMNSKFREGRDGDVSIRVTREYEDESQKNIRGISFNVELEVKNGGVKEISGSYPYMAPVDGYSTLIKHKGNRSDYLTWGGGKYESDVYVQLDNGQIYGKMNIYVGPFFRKEYANILLKGIVNTGNERNLLTKAAIDRSKKYFEKFSAIPQTPKSKYYREVK